MQLSPGTKLGAYEIVAPVGAGGMGEVYRAHDTKLGRDVAIKTLPGGVGSDDAAHTRFAREARAIAALNHPHIVTIHEIAQSDGLDFIVMEFVAGQSLKQLIPARGLPVAQTIEYGHQIASALAAAHSAGIVHRDIKPANIMVTDAGQVKVLDFGLAKPATDAEPEAMTGTAPLATQAGAVLGTVAYMSPEQAQGQPVDVRSDVFSFGAVLYEMCSGRRAFPGDTAVATLSNVLAHDPVSLASIRSDVPADVGRLVAACLQRDRAARPSADEIAVRLASSAQAPARARRPLLKRTLAVAGVLVIAVAGGLFLKRGVEARRVGTSIAAIRQLVQEGNLFEAYVRAREAQPLAPDNAELATLWKEITRPVSITTVPPGAEMTIAQYGVDSPQWIVLGHTPLTDVAVPRVAAMLRLTKPGYAAAEDAIAAQAFWPTRVALVAEGASPPSMVRAIGPGQPTSFYLVPGADPVELQFPDFWIGRHEVTNREYKAFVDAGGYRRREFWSHPFVKSGRVLPWDEVVPTLRDATGRPGPSTWQAGTFPEGQEEWPVTGVSWYEAAAYLRFAGHEMPTLPHWQRAAGYAAISQILPRANFRGRGAARVGTSRAFNRFGSLDFAGNVKEWVVNAAGGDLRYILGGAWDEPAYMFTDSDARPALERAANFGIRAARFDAGDRTPEKLGAAIVRPDRDYSKETPVADAVFAAYRGFFAYDRAPIRPATAAMNDTHAEWRIETVTFPAAYGGETVTVHVFLPKQVPPPFQAVLYMAGSVQFVLRSSKVMLETPPFAHVLRSGRAVVAPIVKGAFERGSDQFSNTTPKETALWRDYTVAIVKDLARTLDYVETRPDIDRDRIGFLGNSRGAALSPLILALEPQRLKTAVLMIPGLYLARPAPEVDVFNYLPRVKQPVLMLSGRFDFIFPERSSQLPFFQGLGAPADRKRRLAYDSGHNLPPTENIKETLDWLDKTLGPVRR